MRVRDIMTTDIVSIGPEASVKDAAKLLFEHHLTGLPVLKDGELVGIITEADLIMQQAPIKFPLYLQLMDSLVYFDNPLDGDEVSKQLRKILATKVAEVMTREAVTIEADAEIGELAQLMISEHLNPVPVRDRGRIVGMVSRADIVELLAREDV